MTARRAILAGAVLVVVAACVVWALSVTPRRSESVSPRAATSVSAEAPDGRAPPPSDAAVAPPKVLSRVTLTIEVTRTPGVPVADAVCHVFALESRDRVQDKTDTLFVEPQDAAEPLATVRTDAAGRAVAPNLERGAFHVTAEAPGLSRGDARVSITAGATVRITLGASLALGGTARRPDGSAVAGLRLVVAAATSNDREPGQTLRSSTTTGPDGTWRVDRLPPGSYEVWTWRVGRGLQRQASVALHGNETLDLTMTDGGMVRGRVTDDETGNGIAGVRVVLWDDDWDVFAKAVAGAVTVADGTFSAPTYAESAQVAKIDFARPGYARTWTTERFGVSAGETHEVNVAMHASRASSDTSSARTVPSPGRA